ncbi:hypothetical protein GCM10009504_17400 [Pseudomonas laurentiana]|uniref:GNAT family N-acetyltransferase n=1 Tax=Pseudomonas laurentiana TaxID=2364649 RepID=UPI001678D3CC|nr:GNAT family N-acetyltransferase [Pseudomonas laurentiana]GGU60834.1 hypothetical protein GCM10009504_17400 [Pseudomonas laurentiana]
MPIEWLCKHHSDLGKEQLHAILQLRAEVFVVEQKCPYLDIDGQDLASDTCHLMAWQDDTLVAYLRLLDPTSQGGDVVIGRVLIAPHARGKGLGHELMDVGSQKSCTLSQIDDRPGFNHGPCRSPSSPPSRAFFCLEFLPGRPTPLIGK